MLACLFFLSVHRPLSALSPPASLITTYSAVSLSPPPCDSLPPPSRNHSYAIPPSALSLESSPCVISCLRATSRPGRDLQEAHCHPGHVPEIPEMPRDREDQLLNCLQNSEQLRTGHGRTEYQTPQGQVRKPAPEAGLRPGHGTGAEIIASGNRKSLPVPPF